MVLKTVTKGFKNACTFLDRHDKKHSMAAKTKEHTNAKIERKNVLPNDVQKEDVTKRRKNSIIVLVKEGMT